MADATDLTYQTAYALAPASTDDPELIRRQIDHTRTQLASTINAIGERLSPDNLIEQAKSSAKEATVGRIKDMTHQANRKVEGMSNGLSQTIRDNPLPVAVIGLGLGWLLLSERGKRDAYRMEEFDDRGRGYRYYGDEPYGRPEYYEEREGMREAAHSVERKAAEVKHRVGEAAQSAGAAVSDVAHRAGEGLENTTQRLGEALSETSSRMGDSLGAAAERVGETADSVQERAGEAATRTREEAERLRREAEWRSRMAMRRTRQSFWQTMEENPLAVGAVLTIAGAAVGAAIPATEYENKLMGETRDRLMDEARVRAQDAVGRVQSVVEDTQRAVVTEAKEAARRHDLNIDDTIETDASTY